jgi:serine/threonine protein phosphatase PrpC
MKIRYAGSTHVGRKRAHNEDNFFLFGDQNLYVVADGMGGHASGEVASQMAVETLAKFYQDGGRDPEMTWPHRLDSGLSLDENRLLNGIKLANREVFAASRREARLQGMGTTLVSLVCGPTGAYMGHVGDSRGYLVRQGAISQVTEDHSLLNDYLKVHAMTPQEIENFPHKNVIVRALGMKDTVAVDVQRLTPQPGDMCLLCSDGLSGMISDQVILDVLQKNTGNLEQGCQGLIAAANAHGGQDNITVVLVEFS